MIPVDEARSLIRALARPVSGADRVPLREAVGRGLAGPVAAERDDPPFARAMMDGYAVRSGETAKPPARLEVVGRVAAGDLDLPVVRPGCAVWVNTGAPLPPGADSVVPVEWTRGEVEILEAPGRGAHVQPRGALVRAGEKVAEGLLTPERLAVCAAQGADPVQVLRRPTVALLATGSELKSAPGAHEIRNSNGPLLGALLSGCQVIDLGVAADERGELDDALENGLAADVLVTTGGVSKGELDLVRPGLEARGVTVVVHGVALQPGKPFLFGTHESGAAVFGLPGNPASALVCADLFLLPYLAARRGRDFDGALFELRGHATGPVLASPNRQRVFPCVRRGDLIDPLPWRSSADLYTLPRANAYMVIEAGEDLSKGGEVRVLVPERFAAWNMGA
ncbi:MAG: molybdopterin molybdotransferase MoeA [Planctomycetota bacterium]|jgi:molybdopterin molybdotransferase